jgi:hypothetical protein
MASKIVVKILGIIGTLGAGVISAIVTFLYVRNPGQDLGVFISGIWFLIIPFIIFSLMSIVAYYKPPEERDKRR